MSSDKLSPAPALSQPFHDSHRSSSARQEVQRVRRKADNSGKPFIVDTSATMLKKNELLSRNARQLYLTMRALADGKTGELRIGGRWLKATVFDRAAEMCKNTRLPAMRELIASGFVTLDRPRIWRTIGGRMRAVAGRPEYTVHRKPVPKNHRKANHSSKVHLQESISSTVQEMNSQVLPNPPFSPGVVVSGGIPGSESILATAMGHNHQNLHPADDGFSASPSKNFTETAKTFLLSKGHDSRMVDIALARVADLAGAKKKIPRSPAYFVTSVERAFADPEERAAIEAVLARRAEIGVSSDAPLDPTEKHPASKISMVHEVVEEAARTGRPAREVLGEHLVPGADAIIGRRLERRGNGSVRELIERLEESGVALELNQPSFVNRAERDGADVFETAGLSEAKNVKTLMDGLE